MSTRATKRETKTYALKNKEARKLYDLREHEDLIADVVHSVNPELEVSVSESSYTVYDIRKGESLIIGKRLSSSGVFNDAIVVEQSLFVGVPSEKFDDSKVFDLNKVEKGLGKD